MVLTLETQSGPQESLQQAGVSSQIWETQLVPTLVATSHLAVSAAPTSQSLWLQEPAHSATPQTTMTAWMQSGPQPEAQHLAN